MPNLHDYDYYRNWPSSTAVSLSFADHADFNSQTIDRVGAMPQAWEAFVGQVLAVTATDADVLGPQPAGMNSGALSFAGKPVGGHKPYSLEPITSTIALTDAAHCGATLRFNPGSPMTLQLSTSEDPATGLVDQFWVQCLRLRLASSVTLSFSGGLVNRNPNDHTRLARSKFAIIYVNGTDVYFGGGTEP